MTDENGALCAQDIYDAADAIRRQSDEMMRAPRGPCGCAACVVHPDAHRRLTAEGGYGRCANCYAVFYIPPPEER